MRRNKKMIKIFIGGKGSGKTKTLIELTNAAAQTSNGSVVCIEKGDKLKHEITYKARLIDTDYYSVTDATTLYGFIAGILASNSDITDIFVDSSLKICGNDVAAFAAILPNLEKLTSDVNLVMSASIAVEECPEEIKKYA
jgi:Ni2+-binding GTPase involved in maturation of urease and hydrogenase